MLEERVGLDDHRVHISYAFFIEKYRRDFSLTQQVYESSLDSVKNHSSRRLILNEMKNFQERMTRRKDRDVKSKVTKSDEKKIS
mmetsp:Transcript_18826/g.17979  ORF Transcript_18826/g.17979 Transcript_18826/m.17979 type:complete len:84 (+) Transcript_18826:499-750(+)